MKRVLALVLVFAFVLCGCGDSVSETYPEKSVVTATADNMVEAPEEATVVPSEMVADEEGKIQEEGVSAEVEDSLQELLLATPTTEPVFTDFNDPEFQQYVNDCVYAGLVDEFSSEDYIIESVESLYISQEYLEETEYNSQENIFFGYTLADIDQIYQGEKFVFSLGTDGTTVVQPFENYDTTYEQVIQNVAVGTGVILICVTVSVATGGAGLAPISMVFASSAETATAFALSSASMGAISAGIIEGMQTKDFDSALKAAALAGSEGFKWGAISGAFVGGMQKMCAINRVTKSIGTAQEYVQGTVEIPSDAQRWRQAELRYLNEHGGYEQLAYKNGKQVVATTSGSTRPDVIIDCIDHIEAVDVKYYDLKNPNSLRTLYRTLIKEISARVENLPAGSTQRIVLDVTDRGFSPELCETVKNNIWVVLDKIYPQIPIEVVGLV